MSAKKPDRTIGSRFTFDGAELEVVKYIGIGTCDECYFAPFNRTEVCYSMRCLSYERVDETPVVFKKVEP